MRAISFAIPAHNEAESLPLAVRSIRESCAACGVVPEIVVANDASSDATAAVAEALGARVVSHDRRQIAATRNAAARASTHAIIIFLDADTQLTPRALVAILQALEAGALGGGTWATFDHGVGLWGKAALWITVRLLALGGGTGGACVFCRREIFEKINGFDETFYAGEEVFFARSIAQHGRFAIIREPVITSGRKVRTFSVWELSRVVLRGIFSGGSSLKSRVGLDLWYGERRPDPAVAPPTPPAAPPK